jgi:hypothetical protein
MAMTAETLFDQIAAELLDEAHWAALAQTALRATRR